MRNHGQDCPQRWRITRCVVCIDPLENHPCFRDCPLDEGPCRSGIAPLREIGIDDLSILIKRALDVGPATIATDIQFINSPFRAD
jgi:hypothetical protein